MTIRPRDISDLYLAPVTLEIEAELERLAPLSHDELTGYVSLRTDRTPNGLDQRRRGLLDSLAPLNGHGWSLSWSPRGLVVRHDDHTVTLGVSESIRTYVEL